MFTRRTRFLTLCTDTRSGKDNEDRMSSLNFANVTISSYCSSDNDLLTLCSDGWIKVATVSIQTFKKNHDHNLAFNSRQ